MIARTPTAAAREPAPGGRPGGPAPGLRLLARRTLLQVAAVLAVLVAAVAVLRDRLPRPEQVWQALLGADTRWLVVAFVAEGLSLGMFAHQQRRLLTAFGVPISLGRARAIAYSRSAIAISLPAGSALSAGFAFRQFRAGGASRSTAATVMVLSGVVSTVALALLYLTGLLAAATAPLGGPGARYPLMAAASALLVAAAVVVGSHLRRAHRTRRRAPEPQPAGTPAVDGLARRWPAAGRRVRVVLAAVDRARGVPARHWNLALAYAAVNWLADLGCLAAAAYAFGLTQPLASLAAVYVGGQFARQIPLTPGGVGLIEASLLAGLVATGASQAAAAAAVLVYRLLSCWLVIPVGLLAWNRLRRLPRHRCAGPRLG